MGVALASWNRYGKRRTYVNDGDTSLGYRDEATGEVHVTVAARAAEVHEALATLTPERSPRNEAREQRRRSSLNQARAQRSWRAPTLSEKALADELLRSSPFAWAREVAWGNYRPDFYCALARLIVEVDGSSHRRRRQEDADRDAYFRGLGIETLRIDARDVERDSAAVVARINRVGVARAGAVPPTEVPARGLIARVLGRTEPVERPPLAPERFEGRRRGSSFVCARCRVERGPADRSLRSASCCTACEP